MRTAIRGICIAAILTCSAQAHSQETLVGKYEGRYRFYATAAAEYIYIPADLEITRAADGKIAGSFEILRYQCRDKYSVEGTYQDNKLTLQVSKGSTMDCGGQSLTLSAEGGKLRGMLAASEIELSKR